MCRNEVHNDVIDSDAEEWRRVVASGSIHRRAALDAVSVLASILPCSGGGNTQGPILLSLEFEHTEQIIEAHGLFILGLLFLRKRPSNTLSRQLCRPSRQVFFHCLEGSL